MRSTPTAVIGGWTSASLRIFAISRENVMAAGDNLNDGPMLRFAGNQWLWETIDDVKNIAKYIAKPIWRMAWRRWSKDWFKKFDKEALPPSLLP
ncbi:MAG: HAD hydrolase family protein [[Clostridium] leptum]